MNFFSLKSRQKAWGVLIYACGNNDLEPEITEAVLALNSVDWCRDIGVAFQLARAPQRLVCLLRPSRKNLGIDGDWQGVRRYLFTDSTGIKDILEQRFLLDELGNINMAHPASLYDFLIWALAAVKARRYVLILSGHGAGFIGALADFTNGRPQIMGIPHMTAALQRARESTGKKIDIMIMDACYMNLLENLYEFSLSGAVDIFLGAGGLIPLEGYEYGKIIEILGRQFGEPKEVARQIKDYHQAKITISGSAEAILLNRKILNRLQRQLSRLAHRFTSLGIRPCDINKSEDNLVDLCELLVKANDLSSDDGVKKGVLSVFDLLKKINLADMFNKKHCSVNIFCPGQREDFSCLSSYYSGLQFSKDNFWLTWLAGDEKNISVAAMNDSLCNSLNSVNLPLGLLTQHLLSLNVQMTLQDIEIVYKKLGWI